MMFNIIVKDRNLGGMILDNEIIIDFYDDVYGGVHRMTAKFSSAKQAWKWAYHTVRTAIKLEYYFNEMEV